MVEGEGSEWRGEGVVERGRRGEGGVVDSDEGGREGWGVMEGEWGGE